MFLLFRGGRDFAGDEAIKPETQSTSFQSRLQAEGIAFGEGSQRPLSRTGKGKRTTTQRCKSFRFYVFFFGVEKKKIPVNKEEGQGGGGGKRGRQPPFLAEEEAGVNLGRVEGGGKPGPSPSP